MNIFPGILQRLIIIEQTETRLILRELPLFDYAVAFALIITGLILSVVNFWFSAGIAAVIALYFILQGRVRMIVFDADTGGMIVLYQTPLKKVPVSEIDLAEIKRAYLFKGDDGGTQIILVQVDGEEIGISVYSNDMNPWKDDIVIAINAILYQAHKASKDE